MLGRMGVFALERECDSKDTVDETLSDESMRRRRTTYSSTPNAKTSCMWGILDSQGVASTQLE